MLNYNSVSNIHTLILRQSPSKVCMSIKRCENLISREIITFVIIPLLCSYTHVISWSNIVTLPEGQWEASNKNCTRWRKQTHRQTDRQTYRRTWRLYDQLGPVGPSWWKCNPQIEIYYHNVSAIHCFSALQSELKKALFCHSWKVEDKYFAEKNA